MSLQKKHIGFIGGGNMAEALITGLLKTKSIPARQVWVSEPRQARRRQLKHRFHIKPVSTNVALIQQAQVVVLAIKPQQMSEVLAEIRPYLTTHHLIVSIAAGIDTQQLRKGLGTKTRVIRAMPNTPALIGQGITGLYADKTIRTTDLKLAQLLFQSVGTSLVFQKESELDWVTALSGSGPAYVFLFLESLITVGLKAGLSRDQAHQLALNTCQGAAALAAQSNTDLKTLRERVTSKGGTTAAALEVLKKTKWDRSLQQAVKAAAKRAQELRVPSLKEKDRA